MRQIKDRDLFVGDVFSFWGDIDYFTHSRYWSKVISIEGEEFTYKEVRGGFISTTYFCDRLVYLI
jgi:hypothetical protein